MSGSMSATSFIAAICGSLSVRANFWTLSENLSATPSAVICDGARKSSITCNPRLLR